MTISIQNSVGLNGVNNPDDVLAVKSRLVELGFPFVTADSAMGPLTIKAIRLFQAMKNGLNVVNDQRNDGRVDVNGDTFKWLQAVNAPQWQRMPAGSVAEGFLNDNIAHVSDNHDFGTSWMADITREGCHRQEQQQAPEVFSSHHKPSKVLITPQNTQKPVVIDFKIEAVTGRLISVTSVT